MMANLARKLRQEQQEQTTAEAPKKVSKTKKLGFLLEKRY